MDTWQTTDQLIHLLTFLTACLPKYRTYLTLFLLSWQLAGQAQDTVQPDRLSTLMINPDRVDITALTTADLIVINNGVHRYITNAKMAHHGILLFSDLATHESGTSVLNGSGHVLLVQGDTITIQADSMQYDAVTRQATLIGRVMFQDRRTLLTTPRLDYTLSAGAFCYTGQSRFTDDKHTITSEGGCYDVRTGCPTAKPAVSVAKAILPLRTDTLQPKPITLQATPPARPTGELKATKTNKQTTPPVVLVDAASEPLMGTAPKKTTVFIYPPTNAMTARLPQASAKPSRELPSQNKPVVPSANESDLERMLNRRPRPSTVSNFY